MHGAGKMFRGFQLALDECLIDDHFRGDIRKLASLPSLHLLSHRLEVPLYSVNANRDAVDERERLRVFRKNGGKHAWNNVANFVLAQSSRFSGMQLSPANVANRDPDQSRLVRHKSCSF